MFVIWCVRVCVCTRTHAKLLGYIQLFTTRWTIAHQTPLSLGFSRQEYWSGLLFLPPGNLPNPGITPGSPALQADSLPSEPPGKSSFTMKRYKSGGTAKGRDP